MARVTRASTVFRRLRALPPKLRAQGTSVLFVAGGIIEAQARETIFRGAIQGDGHIPSAPGEPPNADTGLLASRIVTEVVGQLKVQVKSTAPYAAPLEFGADLNGDGRQELAPRPYMAPAARSKRREVSDLVARGVARLVRQVGN